MARASAARTPDAARVELQRVGRRGTSTSVRAVRTHWPERSLRVVIGDLFAVSIVVVLGLGLVVAGQAVRTGRPFAGIGASSGSPDALKASAGRLLAASVAKGGSGYRFEIVQRSTIKAQPGGPQVPIPDPADPHGKPIGLTDELYQLGLVETGFVTPDGFSMEMRAGPMAADAKVDLTGGALLFRALVAKGVTYRDDGQGWYPTDDPPGIGLDPRTAALLPTFLDRATDAKDIDKAALADELGVTADPAARAIEATGAVDDLPGVVAVDGQAFTELTAPVALTFDAQGRLTGLLVTARNTNLEAFDLVVVTEIAIHYDDVPSVLPEPLPALPAEAKS